MRGAERGRPPRHGPPGRRRRPPARVMWRYGAMFAAFMLVAGGLIAAGVWALATAVGVGSPSGGLRGAAIGVLVIGVLGLVALSRIARRTAAPVGALIEAASRIEDGDYAARVPERGPGELRRLARTFNGMSERLELVDAGRRAFLADVAHELRTPLTVIRGRVEAMLDGVHPRDDEQLGSVLAHAIVLERLVEDVRTVALAETGSLELRREPIEATLLLNESAADFAGAATREGIALQVEVSAELPALDVDSARIRQVLVNLLANALRYTQSGDTITLSAGPGGEGVSGRDAGSGTTLSAVAIEVRDTGSGVDEALLERVFERFAKGGDSPGVGLGLAIARDIVEAHGGTIVVESVAGEETAVRMLLPTAA